MASQYSSRSYLTFLSLLILVLVIVYQQFVIIEQDVRSALALEQVKLFHQLSDTARADRPMDVGATIQSVQDYYPSGTKQASGSSLDRLVEECRQFAIEQIKRGHSNGEINDW